MVFHFINKVDRLRDIVFVKGQVTFFEYLEKIALYCYKVNNNLKTYRLKLRQRSGDFRVVVWGSPCSLP